MKKLLNRIFKKTVAASVTERISTDFTKVNISDIESVLSSSWQDPSVPQRQYEACTKKELDNYRKGLPVMPFDVFMDILQDNIPDLDNKSLLEIGCSSGYYSEVLKIKGINLKYSGCDYSEAFIKFARELFRDIDFQVQDARSLTYTDRSFDIVVSGCCLLHILNYKKAIEETARVAKEYVIFHRTPVLHEKETSYFIKTAYGVKMFEIHFNERELLKLMKINGLKVIDIITFSASFDSSMGDFYAYKTYLCQKSQNLSSV